MSLPTINLDDRRFDDLLEAAHRQIRQSCPGWTDLSAGDPGVVLLEVFAHLTEVMLYRLNRIPDKVHIELLNLLGVNLQPPSAAAVELVFGLRQASTRKLEIPRGTRVTVARGGGGDVPPVFTTVAATTLEPGKLEGRTRAYHAEFVEGELIGQGSGSPALILPVARPPIVNTAAGGPELVIGVAVPDGGLPPGARGLQFEGTTFRVWREVESFSDLGDDRHVYLADRHQGRIQFAPALRARPEGTPDQPLEDAPRALAEIPAAGAEVRAWYWRGGGVQGNVAAETLTLLKDGIAGITVTNPQPAVGGRAAESLANAMARGPQEIHSLKRAVTARDFELCALRTGAVDRAHAYTKAALWHHAPPGTVEVLLLPHIPEAERGTGPVTAEVVRAHCERNMALLPRIRQELDLRRPLGTNCLVNWAHCKPVQVRAQVVVFREESPAAVAQRVLQRLYRHINPLPVPPDHPGWVSGQPLTSWHVYRTIGAEPGVKSINRVRLVVDDVPDLEVTALAADRYQERTWYAGSRDTLYRSMNDGQGWEPVQKFVDETIVTVRPFDQPAGDNRLGSGLVAVVTAYQDARARIHLSRDCGETWEILQPTAFPVADAAWLERDGRLSLLLATDRGLFELAISAGADPVPLVVDPQDLKLGFYRVAVLADGRTTPAIAVAARDERGVFLSTRAGEQGSFQTIGLDNQLVRVLAVQQAGPHRYLWAGLAAAGSDPGKGCYRWRLTTDTSTPSGWEELTAGWADQKAGSCLGLGFLGGWAFAATRNRGVLRLDSGEKSHAWQAPDVNCGLPLREVGRLQPVATVAASPRGGQLLAAGPQGVYRSADQGRTYQNCSAREYETEVTVPPNWLFCSNEHQLEVIPEDASG